MRSLRRSRSILALAIGLSLAITPAAGAVAAPADPAFRPLEGSAPLVLAPTEPGDARPVALVTNADDGRPADPGSVVFTATAGTPATAVIDTTALASADPVGLAMTAVSSPDEGALSIADADAVLLDSRPDGARSASVPGAGPTALQWTFTAAGRYDVDLVVTDGTALDPQTLAAGTVDESHVRSAPATYTFEVAEADAPVEKEEAPAPEPGAAEADPTGSASEHAAEAPAGASVAPVAQPAQAAAAYTVLNSDGKDAPRYALYPRLIGDGGTVVDPNSQEEYPTAADFAPIWVDRGLTDEDERVAHGPSETVLQLSDKEYDTANGVWSTNGDRAEGDNRLVFGIGDDGNSFNAPYRLDTPTVRPVYTFTAFSGPEGGDLRLYAAPRTDAPRLTWDSAALRAGTTQPAITQRLQTGAEFGLALSAPGRYCLTVQISASTKSAGTLTPKWVTYTIVAGAVPADMALCDQVPAPGGGTGPTDPTDPVDPGAPSNGPIAVVDSGHTDLRAGVTAGLDGTQTLKIGKDKELVDPADFLFSGTPPAATVPAPTADAASGAHSDWTAIGPVGSKYWYFPMSSSPADGPDFLWPGFSTESVASGDIKQPITFTLNGFSLDGVAQPAGVDLGLLATPDASDTQAANDFNTRTGLPSSFSTDAGVHSHPLWWFTAEGTYCVNMSASTQLRNGSWVTDTALITMLVGDTANAGSAQATTCERAYPDRSTWPTGRTRIDPSTGTADRITVGPGGATLASYLGADGTLNTTLEAGVAQPSVHAPGSAVIPADRTFRANWYAASPAISAERLPVGTLLPGSALSVTMGAVKGPGNVTATLPAFDRGTVLDSSKKASSLVVGAGVRHNAIRWEFSAAGTYCVPLTWTGTSAAGNPLSTTETVTFVAGGTDPATVTPCALGGSGGSGEGPGAGNGGSGTVTDAQVYVKNGSKTRSGAVILNDGHIDVASRIVDGTLQTVVKDTTQSNVPVYHPLTGSHSASGSTAGVVLQLLPESKTKVSAATPFLGAAGSDVWQVNQVQQTELGLLWPGWSTEEIPSADTQGGVSWTLNRMDGPGTFAVYQDPVRPGGAAQIVFNSGDGLPDPYTIPKQTHAHGYWAVSAQGTYCLGFTRSATLASGANVKDDFVLTVVAGRVDVAKTDPSACFNSSVPEGANSGSAPSPEDAAAETTPAVSRTQEVCGPSGTVLSSGHIDFGSRIVNGSLRSLVKDGTTQSVVWREPASTVLWLKPAARVTSPGGAFSSLLGPAGASAWQVPQTQQPGLIWLGWNTEQITNAQARSGVSWTLDSVDGPGTVSVYELASFGAPVPVLTAGGTFTIPLNTHAHGNWAFSKEGVYKLHFTQSVTLANGQTSTDRQVLTIAVGETDPRKALGVSGDCATGSGTVATAAQLDAGTLPADSGTTYARRAQKQQQSAAAAMPFSDRGGLTALQLVLLIGGGVVVLAAGAAGGTLYLRRVRSAARS